MKGITRAQKMMAAIAFIFIYFIFFFTVGYVYNTNRLRNNPELLFPPTPTYAATAEPFLVVSTPAPLRFDTGLENPTPVGTPLIDLLGDE